MTLIQRIALWLAALSMTAGMACIAAFLHTRDSVEYLLGSALFFALFGVACVFLSVIAIWIGSSWFAFSLRPVFLGQSGAVQISSSMPDQLSIRQEIVSKRLEIDERRFCEETRSPCTSWSLCAPRKEGNATGGNGCPRELSVFDENPEGLPIVQRSGGVPVSCVAQEKITEVSLEELPKTSNSSFRPSAKK